MFVSIVQTILKNHAKNTKKNAWKKKNGQQCWQKLPSELNRFAMFFFTKKLMTQ